jgi:hypothetical protein
MNHCGRLKAIVPDRNEKGRMNLLSQAIPPAPTNARTVSFDKPLSPKAGSEKRWQTDEHREQSRLAMARHRAAKVDRLATLEIMDKILTLLDRGEQTRLQLAEILGVDKRSMSGILANMSQKKMIVRDGMRRPWRVA